jgi:DNA-directed RNA polymerase beta' subunit
MINLDFEVYKRIDQLEEITNQKIHVSNKSETFTSDGLYSEKIFGPLQKFKCQCGKLFGKMNSGKICDKCEVLCGDTDGRSNTFAKIVFPDNIYVVNPIFKSILQQIFGQNAVKSLLAKKDYQTNKEHPYYFSLEKHKLLKETKMKANEKRIETPISDIIALRELFNILRGMEEYKDHLATFVIDSSFLEFIFINYVLVVPPNSRQIIKISPTKILPHPITKCYSQILKNRSKNSGVSDQLFKANPEFFGYTVYKYQALTDEIYDTILKFNFQKKESYIREAMTGKTIEFSQRAVIVPNPALRPYQVGLHTDSVKKIFLPELLNYLYTKYENDTINDQNYTIIDFVQYIYKSFSSDFQIDIREEDFINFLKERMPEFRVMVERQPVLWRYNTSGYLIANVFDDNDVIPPDKLNEIYLEGDEDIEEFSKISDILNWGDTYEEEADG